jgi:small conductance mechanosensitive channel
LPGIEDRSAIAIEPTADNLVRLDADAAKAVIAPLTNDELSALAQDMLAIAKRETQAVVDLGFRKRIAIGTGDPAQKPEAMSAEFDERFEQAIRRRRAAFERLAIVLNEWEKKGGDLEAIAEYRNYRRAVLETTTQALDLKSLAKLAGSWLKSPDGGLKLAQLVLIFLAAVASLFIVAKAAARAATWRARHSHSSSLLFARFVAFVCFWVVMILGFAMIVAFLGLEMTPIVALFGGASFVLAFALQETLGNVFAGVMIMIHRPFDLGERVETNNISGDVVSLSFSSTTLKTPDNRTVTIPNSKVWNNVIVNASDLDNRRVDLEFILIRPSDAIAAIKDLPGLLQENHQVLEQPSPIVQIGGYDGRGALLQVRPWVETQNYWRARHELTEAIMLYLNEQGFTLWHPSIRGRETTDQVDT